VAYLCTAVVSPVSAQTTNKDLESLLSAQHGLYRLSPDQRAALDRIRAAPAPYVEVIASEYADIDFLTLNQTGNKLRFERAVMLLGLLDVPEAIGLLTDLFLRIRSVDAGPLDPLSASALLGQTRLVLLQFDRPVASVTADVIRSLESADYGTRLVGLQYLQRTSVGDTAVANTLARMLGREESPLFGDSIATSVLRALRGPRR
jgi:hypothetical protein